MPTDIARRRLFLWFTAVTLFLALSAAVLLLWSANKGLDVINESFYLLSYRYAADYHASFSSFHLIVNALLGNHQFMLVGYRVAYLVLLLGQSVLFTHSILYWVRARGTQFSADNKLVFAGGERSALFSFVHRVFALPARTLSYNSLNSFFVFSTSSLVLYVSCRRLTDYKTALLCALVGFILVFAFLNKVSTGLLLLGWHTLLLFSLRYRDFKKLLIVLLPAVAVGLAGRGGIFHSFNRCPTGLLTSPPRWR